MSREQKLARYYLLCFAYLLISLAVLGHFFGQRGITIAVLSASAVWMIGFAVVMVSEHLASRCKVVEDERDRMISYRVTFAGSMAGYLALLIGITLIHNKYAMNSEFTLPVDSLYILFALVVLTFGTVRELAVLIYYRI